MNTQVTLTKFTDGESNYKPQVNRVNKQVATFAITFISGLLATNITDGDSVIISGVNHNAHVIEIGEDLSYKNLEKVTSSVGFTYGLISDSIQIHKPELSSLKNSTVATVSLDKNINTTHISFDSDHTYDNIWVSDYEISEDTIMDNNFFESVSSILYKVGFYLFGVSAVLFTLLWVLKIIPSGIGLVGTVMSSSCIFILLLMKRLFKGAFSW